MCVCVRMVCVTDSPITQRLLRIGLANSASESDSESGCHEQKNDHSSSSDSSNQVHRSSNSDSSNNQAQQIQDEAILLFVRIVGEPYCCLGPVTVLNCNFDRHPQVVHWRLTQYDSLMTGASRENFNRILKSSPIR